MDLSRKFYQAVQSKKEWAQTLESACKKQLVNIQKTLDSGSEGFQQAFKELSFEICETQTLANGEVALVTYQGRDGNFYPQRKPVEVRISIMEEMLAGWSKEKIQSLATEWDTRNTTTSPNGKSQNDLQKDKGGNGKEYANADTFTEGSIIELQLQLESALKEVDYLQSVLDRSPNSNGAMKRLNHKMELVARLESQLTHLGSMGKPKARVVELKRAVAQ
jgi:hypothetical protein